MTTKPKMFLFFFFNTNPNAPIINQATPWYSVVPEVKGFVTIPARRDPMCPDPPHKPTKVAAAAPMEAREMSRSHMTRSMEGRDNMDLSDWPRRPSKLEGVDPSPEL